MTGKWIRDYLDDLTKAFLGGAGEGSIFECQYLCYLHCLVALEYGPQRAASVWPGWLDICREGDLPPQCLASHTSPEELVGALTTYRHHFDGPSRQWRVGSSEHPSE